MSLPAVRGRIGRLPLGPALAIVFAVVYACFLTRSYYWDGLSFAIEIEHAQSLGDLFNVHHLLYDFIGYSEYLLAGRAVRALYFMQWTNCLAGAVLIWLAYHLFGSLDVPPANSAACAAIVATAATFWKFTTDADSYILANLFLVAAYLSIPRAPVRGALFHFFALMMHQLSSLFFPVALLLLWRSRKERFWKPAAVYTLISAGLTLAMYGLAFRLATHKPPGITFTGWLRYHAEVPFFFKPLSGAGWLFLGTARLFAGGKLEGFVWIAAVLALTLVLWAIHQLVKSRRELVSIGTAQPLLVWAGVYVAFLLIWEPYNTFYRLFYLLPLVGLLAVATRSLSPRPVAALAGALLCWNFFGYIYPNTRVEKNQILAFALAQQKQWPAGTGIIFGQFVPDLWTISYFNPQVSWIPLEQPDPARVAAYVPVIARQGGKLYLDWTYLQRAGRPASRFQFELVK